VVKGGAKAVKASAPNQQKLTLPADKEVTLKISYKR
jgi:hypothetical protein